MMRKVRAYCLLLVLAILAGSCGPEKAHEPAYQELLIASDFLNYKDLLLFKSFEEKQQVKVRLKKMSADSILDLLSKKGYNSGLDLVFLRSSLSFCNFSESNLLHKFDHRAIEDKVQDRFLGNSSNWIGVSIDPYIIIQYRDSNSLITNYRDLINYSFYNTNLTKANQFHAFFTGIFHRTNDDEQALKLSDKLTAKKLVFSVKQDSIVSKMPLLTTYSSFYADPKLTRSTYKKGRIIFPNQKQGGTFYELRSIAVVKQASNYTNAIDFVHYLCANDNNQRINNWWNTFPVSSKLERSFEYQNQRFKLYPVPTRNMCKIAGKVKK